MKIPSKVIIAGIEFKVQMKKFLASGENSVTYGESHYNLKEILIAKNKEMYTRNEREFLPVLHNENVKTFYHELWHMICMITEMDAINDEVNAEMFGLLCGNEMFRNIDDISVPVCHSLMKNVTLDMRKAGLISVKQEAIVDLCIRCIDFKWDTKE